MSRPRRSIVAPKQFGNIASPSQITAQIEASILPAKPPLLPPAPAPVVEGAPVNPPVQGEAPAAPIEGAQAGLLQQLPPPAVEAEDVPQVEETQEEEEESEEDDFTIKRDRSKRPSRAKAAVAKREGQPAPQRKNAKYPSLLAGIFTRFPLEILYEVFGQLSDLDSLLYLGRTNKALRSHLFTIQAKPIWERVWTRQGLPPLCQQSTWERTWTIPETVSLMYDVGCLAEGCAKNGVVEYFTRTRYCKNCSKEAFDVENWAERIPIIWSLVPVTQTPPGRSYRVRKSYAVVEVLNTVRAELLRLFGREEGAVETEEEAAALGAAMDVYLQAALDRQEERAVEARVLRDWMQEKHRRDVAAKRNESNARFDQIVDRCLKPPHNIGKDDLDRAINVLPRGLFFTRTALTDRIFNRILPTILAKIEEFKEERLQRDIDAALEFQAMLAAEAQARRAGGSPS